MVLVLVHACKKDSDGSATVAAGDPVATSLSPDSAAVSTVLTLQGTGLGDIRSIVFDKNNAPAAFYPTLNTGTAIIFRVPDTAVRGTQNIVFTNSAGKTLKVPFKVLPFGVVNSAFPTDFQAGSLVTLTGNNLDVVTKVTLAGTTDQATIVSQSLTQAVIKMPASTVARAALTLTTSAGDKTTPMDFVNVDQATAQVFTDDFVNPAQSWSWGGTYDPSADYIVTGAKALKAAYDPTGSWGGLQIGMGSEVPLPTGTKYFSFWARGADADVNMTVEIKGNNWSTDNSKVITIPAGKWTHFTMEIGSFIPGVSSISVIVFQINGAGKTIYYDNIMFTR
jgi:hypothetical protein